MPARIEPGDVEQVAQLGCTALNVSHEQCVAHEYDLAATLRLPLRLDGCTYSRETAGSRPAIVKMWQAPILLAGIALRSTDRRGSGRETERLIEVRVEKLLPAR